MGETRQPSVLTSLVDSGGGNTKLDPRGTGQEDVKRRRELGTLGLEEEKEKQQANSLATEEDLQEQSDVEQRPLITEESGSHLVLIQPWEQEKHVRKMKVAF